MLVAVDCFINLVWRLYMVDFLLYIFNGDVCLMIFGCAGLLGAIVFFTEYWWVDWAADKLIKLKEKMKRKKK